MKLIELFSGKGVVSRVFREAGWETEEVDILYGLDVREYHAHRADAVWASPPCESYSYWTRQAADTRLWLQTLRIVRESRANIWWIENVRGAAATWGIPAFRWGAWWVWSNRLLKKPKEEPPLKMWKKSKRERAEIPEPLARAALEAATNAT
jgi:site-specific DNA-cytosine methylase